MNFISIQDAIDRGEGEVAVRGWVYRERGSNSIRFIVLRDSSNIIQCAVRKNDVSPSVWESAQKASIESSVQIEGSVKKDERAPTGYEIIVKDLEIIGHSGTYPITRDQSTEFLLDKRHLWIRSRRMVSIMKIRSTVFGAIHEFFRNRNFYEMAPPIFTPSACEGGSTLFEVKYFDDVVYLTQSWQLYAEAAIFGMERIYCISPCFRAEKSKTSRHLAEFWMAEMEAAWMTLTGVAESAKGLVQHILLTVLEKNREELKILERDVGKLETAAKKEYPSITYTEALRILKEKEGMDVQWGKDLRTVEEDLLMKHFDTPVVVTEYPKETMAFYKPEKKEKHNAPGPVALCFDMLAPEGYGEIVGGSERDSDIEALKKALEKEGELLDNYEWYLDIRRYGSVPHSGFGLGVERIVAWICGLDNIKDAIPFPRTMMRKSP